MGWPSDVPESMLKQWSEEKSDNRSLMNLPVRVRLWTWIRTSPIAEAGLFLWLMYLYANQQGWQRWLFFSTAMVSCWDVFSKADKQWLRKPLG